jgi:NADH:ubiquinone reductase (non-electrogenic)
VQCAREIVDEKTGKKCQHSDAELSDGTKLPFGMMVWSAGLRPVKFCDNTAQFQKGPTGRVLVDRFLRVQLNPDLVDGEYASQGLGLAGRVYGIGDAVVNAEAPLVPLASVAEQQADYLSCVLNDHLVTSLTTTQKNKKKNNKKDLPLPGKIPVSSFPPFPSFFYNKSKSFRYISRGAMSSMGSFRGLVDMSHIDTPFGKAPGHIAHSGLFGFLAWHSYYFSKQYSWSNMILNPLMKLKAMCFGRDISRF